jgi:glutathione synthase
MQFLFVMDPAGTMNPDKDTTFAFMEGAQARGHKCFHALPSDVGTQHDEPSVWTRSISVSRTGSTFELGALEGVPVSSFDAVFIRKDPPFDANYLYLTQILELAEDKTFILNRPGALRDANEKLFTLRFSEWMPETLVSAAPREIRAFVERVGEAVLKPLDGAGGSGVVRLTPRDKNTPALIDLLTSEGKKLAMAQRFLPQVEQGDKRVLLLDGELLGVIRRVPRPEDFRANIHVGGRVEAADLSERELELVRAVGPTLRSHGLYFVGLDLIAEHLIEVNVTSPTGIQELTRFDQGLSETSPVERVIRFVEHKAGALEAARAK